MSARRSTIVVAEVVRQNTEILCFYTYFLVKTIRMQQQERQASPTIRPDVTIQHRPKHRWLRLGCIRCILCLQVKELTRIPPDARTTLIFTLMLRNRWQRDEWRDTGECSWDEMCGDSICACEAMVTRRAR